MNTTPLSVTTQESLSKCLEAFLRDEKIHLASLNVIIHNYVAREYQEPVFSDADREIIKTQRKVLMTSPNLTWIEFVDIIKMFGKHIHISILSPDELKAMTDKQQPSEAPEEKVSRTKKTNDPRLSPGMKNTLDLKLTETNLNPRVASLLFNKGIDYVGQLTQLSRDDIFQISGMGEKSVNQVEDLLHSFGLFLNGLVGEWKPPSELHKANERTSQTVYDKTFEEVNFPVHITKILNLKGFRYIGEVARLAPEELKSKGIVPLIASVVIEKLESLNVKLGTDLKGWKPPVVKPKK